jgi:hypothetical protein
MENGIVGNKIYCLELGMDLLTHTLLTHVLIDEGPGVLSAGIGPDIPWYLTSPLWVAAAGQARRALTTSEWPDPPRWMETVHHACHSFPVALVATLAVRVLSGRWPRQ